MYKLLCFLSLILKSNAFNLDLSHTIIFEDPSSRPNENYFGFSVVLTKKTKDHPERVFIGAPKQTDLSSKGGVMYKCNFTEGCSNLNFPSEIEQVGFINAFIGGSADINNNNTLLITSAYTAYQGIGEENNPKGFLFLTDLRNDKSNLIYPFKNEKNMVNETMKKTKGSILIAKTKTSQAGFSVHFHKTESSTLLMGSPGYYATIGSALKLNLDNNVLTKHFSNEHEYFSGYSVSSGNLYKQGQTVYIKTSPFAYDGLGQIIIFFNHTSLQSQTSETIEHIRSKIPGDGFGYCTTTGDIDGDHLDDIVVGAPFYKTKTFNEGAVYVYLGSTAGKVHPSVEGPFIHGNHTNGHFGMSVMFLNDINADGFGDVAVAAPFQDKGVVYIYHGTATGLNPSASQKIQGKSVYQNLKGFGFSFSKPCDVFNKNVSDLAIGSFLSGHAVILRGRPVVVVTTSLVSIPPYLNKNATEFILQATYIVENKHHPNQTMENITLTRTIEIDTDFKRTNFSYSTENITINIGTSKTENISVKIDNKIKETVPVKLTYVFVDEGQKTPKNIMIKNKTTNNIHGDSFCLRCPIIDKERSSGPKTIDVHFGVGCTNDNICQSNLTLGLRLLDLENNTFNTGTNKKSFVTLEVDIQNSGEYAYSNELIVKLPKGLKPLKTDISCNSIKNETEVLKCPLPRPIVKSEQVKFDLDLEEAIAGSFSGHLLITVELKTKSKNENNLTKEIYLNIDRDVDIYLDGLSGAKAYELSKNGSTTFTQTYRVVKEGSSTIGKVEVSFKFPSYISTNEVGFIQFMYIEIPNKCFFKYGGNSEPEGGPNDFRRKREVPDHNSQLKELNSSNIVVSKSLYRFNIARPTEIICTVGPFNENVIDESLSFTMHLKENVLFDILGGKKKQILYESYGEAKIIMSDGEFKESGNRSNSYTVSTVFVDKLEVTEISIWYIVAAVIAGFLLFLLIVFILMKAGFFKRETKKKLKKLKEENLSYPNASNEDLLNNDNVFTPLPEDAADGDPEETFTESHYANPEVLFN
ncbi:unnamed protein product [Brassicogethes aeneus]|uniref:Integrin alpha second immunoglobulin-like domain-containing protein n=1 Tax=Brassicogethes aeneus TaxID=1431903 RepID=A0A9P0AY68_BRAAE|nr:unnamed protein product [Brassicogethes aeneus]